MEKKNINHCFERRLGCIVNLHLLSSQGCQATFPVCDSNFEIVQFQLFYSYTKAFG